MGQPTAREDNDQEMAPLVLSIFHHHRRCLTFKRFINIGSRFAIAAQFTREEATEHKIMEAATLLGE